MLAVGITLFNFPFSVPFSWFAPFVLNDRFLEICYFTYKCTDPELTVPACPKFRNLYKAFCWLPKLQSVGRMSFDHVPYRRFVL